MIRPKIFGILTKTALQTKEGNRQARKENIYKEFCQDRIWISPLLLQLQSFAGNENYKNKEDFS